MQSGTSDAKFAFDREGRPGAIAAIRGALPMMERDLFDAVIEDCGANSRLRAKRCFRC